LVRDNRCPDRARGRGLLAIAPAENSVAELLSIPPEAAGNASAGLLITAVIYFFFALAARWISIGLVKRRKGPAIICSVLLLAMALIMGLPAYAPELRPPNISEEQAADTVISAILYSLSALAASVLFIVSFWNRQYWRKQP
jgi:hypothetical protein